MVALNLETIHFEALNKQYARSLIVQHDGEDDIDEHLGSIIIGHNVWYNGGLIGICYITDEPEGFFLSGYRDNQIRKVPIRVIIEAVNNILGVASSIGITEVSSALEDKRVERILAATGFRTVYRYNSNVLMKAVL